MTDSSELRSLHDCYASFALKELFNEPSRMGTTSCSCIDNILINTDTEDTAKKVLNLHLSDHLAQKLSLAAKSSVNITTRLITARTYNNENKLVFRHRVESVDWDAITLGGEVSHIYTNFHGAFLSAYDEAFPEKQKRIALGKQKRSYIQDDKITEMRNRLDALYTIFKVTKDSEVQIIYNTLKKEYRRVIVEARRTVIMAELNGSENKMRAVWKVIKEETQRNTRAAAVPDAEITVTADDFNKYFGTIGSKLAATTQGPVQDASEMLQKGSRSVLKSIFLEEVTDVEVLNIAKHLRKPKTRDIYGLSTEILLIVIDVIAQPLANIFNACIKEGTYPGQLELSKIVPIHKKGQKENPSNYRPIAIISTFSKIFEVVLKNRLIKFLEINDGLDKNQHAYRKGRSTLSATTSLLNEITKAFDDKNDAVLTCCDLTKAFDSVNHNLLLEKLYFYGIRGNANKLIESYLGNRSQVVAWNNTISQDIRVATGVPQGSVLGPLLFLIYINDLPKNVSCDRICLFADDTSILVKHKNKEEAIQNAEITLAEADEWFRSNGLHLNHIKTQQVVLTTKHIQENERQTICFLGLHLSNNLCYKGHIQETVKKLAKAAYAVRKMKEVGTHEAARIAYFSLFHARAVYAILLWGHSPDAKTVFTKQKETVRILCNVGYRASCRELFKQENILTIYSVYILTCAEYVHEHRNEYETHSDLHNYNTRGRKEYIVPNQRVESARLSVNYYAIKIYNHLPMALKSLRKDRF